ncbi:choice-of-anchor D domain-containing protein [Angustibacter sp. McL0619]|uniref:choice-of-anchor D domain-containing protein n=1 Tax=Angustibacter sp. McL0619 TaxID=3415676 RepID=UPI003CE687EE
MLSARPRLALAVVTVVAVTTLVPLSAAPTASAAALPADTGFSVGSTVRSTTTSSIDTVSFATNGRLDIWSNDATRRGLQLMPPTGKRFAAGDVLPTAWTTPTGDAAMLQLVNGGCTGPQPGRLIVQRADYAADGSLETLAATFRVPCTFQSTVVVGEVRLRDSAPMAAAKLVPTDGVSTRPLDLGQSTTMPMTLTNVGGVDLPLTTVTTVASPGLHVSVLDDGCSDTVLAVGASCDVSLSATPSSRGTLTAAVTLSSSALPGSADDGYGGSVTGKSSLSVEARPAAPTDLDLKAGVDALALTFAAGAVDAGAGPATSYEVERIVDGESQRTWSVQPPVSGTTAFVMDSDAPVGGLVTYRVRGTNRVGAGDWSQPSAAVTRPPWEGPYDPARFALSLVWDDASYGITTWDTGTTQLLASSNATSQTYDGDYRSYLYLPRDLADGTYQVGTDVGQLPVSVRSGEVCESPTGTAVVSRWARSVTGGVASLSVDLDLSCASGHRLLGELRVRTPDPVHRLDVPPLDDLVFGAITGHQQDRDMTVTNTGGATVRVVDARVLGRDNQSFSVVGTTCADATLEAGQTCTVTVRYAPVTYDWRNEYADVVMDTDAGQMVVGLVVGQQISAFAAPTWNTVTAGPGRVDVSWFDSSGTDGEQVEYRVEQRVAGGSWTTAAASSSARSATFTPAASTLDVRVVARLASGRELAGETRTVTMPTRWLVTSGYGGPEAAAPDADGTDGSALNGVPTYSVAASPSRSLLVTSEQESGYFRLVVRSPMGALVRVLTDGEAVDDIEPAVSPDGRTVMFTRWSGETSHLMTVPVAGGQVYEMPDSSDLGHPSWLPDGTGVVAADQRVVVSGPQFGLVRWTTATGRRSAIAGTAGAYAPVVSRTGTLVYLLTNEVSGRDEVHSTTLSGGAGTVIAGSDWLDDVAWDPTGRWLALSSFAPWADHGTSLVYDTAATPKFVRSVHGDLSAAWYVAASAAPTASLEAPAVSGSSVTATIGAADVDDAAGGLQRQCRLDAGPWLNCDATWAATGLSAGTHTLSARAVDPSGATSATVSRTVVVDRSAPTVTLGAPSAVLSSASVTLTWSGKDTGGAGLRSYEVRRRYASPYGALNTASTPSTWSALTTTKLTTSLSAGHEYCFSVRARDAVGNVGAWSTERCTTVVLDDRYLSASSGWTRAKSTSAAFGTYTSASRTGVSLTRTSVQGRRIAVVATTCSSCGSVDVYQGGVKLGRVSLVSARTTYRHVLWLPLRSTHSGTVVLKTTSSRSVRVDGIAVLH